MVKVNLSRIWIWISIIISVLVTLSSISGIFNPNTYSKETSNWALQAVGQDIGNILAVVVFLTSSYFVARGSVKAYFIWLGTLLYFIYAFLIYAFFIHFNYLFLIYVAILGFSAYTLIGGLIGQNIKQIRLVNNRGVKFASIVLIVTGSLFAILWLSEIIPALFFGQTPVSAATAGLWVNPIQVIDLSLVLPGMILTGLLLWRKNWLGYLFASPWLVFSVLMGTSIVATLFMELNNGNSNAIVPMVMVGVIVLISLFATYKYLK